MQPYPPRTLALRYYGINPTLVVGWYQPPTTPIRLRPASIEEARARGSRDQRRVAIQHRRGTAGTTKGRHRGKGEERSTDRKGPSHALHSATTASASPALDGPTARIELGTQEGQRLPLPHPLCCACLVGDRKTPRVMPLGSIDCTTSKPRRLGMAGRHRLLQVEGHAKDPALPQPGRSLPCLPAHRSVLPCSLRSWPSHRAPPMQALSTEGAPLSKTGRGPRQGGGEGAKDSMAALDGPTPRIQRIQPSGRPSPATS